MTSPSAGIGGRTQQAGTLVAATLLPITFQPTLMPRSALDQALVTGISTSLNYRADLARFIREVYDLPASDDQLAAVEGALRAAELERKRRLDTAKDHSAP